MPESLLRNALSFLLKLFFRVKLRGLEHYHAAGDRVVVVANHQSFLDPLLLAVFLPEKPAFAMNVFQAKKWYFRPLLKLVEVFQVDPSQAVSTKSVIQKLKGGGKVVIFPEGRITSTNGIMKIYDGTGMIIDKSGATVLPVRVEGAQYSKLSRLSGKLRTRLFPRITLTFLPPRRPELPEDVPGKDRRAHARQWLYDLLVETAFVANYEKRTLLEEIMAAARVHGWGKIIAEDINRTPLTYRMLFVRMFVLARGLKPLVGERSNVAVLLPTSLAGLVTVLSLHRLGKVPAMLNFSAGERNITLACAMAEARCVLTSRAFIEKGKLEGLIEALKGHYRIIYLEDVREKLTLKDKLSGLLEAHAPDITLKDATAAHAAGKPAVILYTSGSEGTPKGVALSHANILANVHQASARLSFTDRDVMFNALPIFHSFGLSIGTLLPLALGIKVFLYPSPLHYRVVPELSYDVDATILLGTDTFFRGYASYAHPYDFHSIRLAVAGAEKLKPETRALWAEKFRVSILEGYGVTETSPAVSFNTPMEHKPGSVGRLFPGMNYRLEPVEGLSRGGRLWLKGPNVMLGYIFANTPGHIQPQGEWYDTGDIVEVDADGYIHILGRAKRFAKIGGEMVSLGLVEELASRHWPEAAHAAVSLPDARKGEQILLFSESADVSRSALLAHAQKEGLPEIALPRSVVHLPELPRLGSGKLDYMRLKEEALAHAAAA